MIKPTYVNFEQAKLLKEKGFHAPTLSCYHTDTLRENYSLINQYLNTYSEEHSDDCITIPYSSNDNGVELATIDFNSWGDRYCAALEQWQVVEWLRVVKGVWIQVSINRYGLFYCNILQNQPTKNIDVPMSYEMLCQLNDFKSPTEAYSAAFDYILPKLKEEEMK